MQKEKRGGRRRSSVPAEAEGVVLFPGGPARSVVVAVTLAKATVLKGKVRLNLGVCTNERSD